MQASARLSSSAASKRVIAGVSSAITRSCYRTSRGKAHAAPLSAQEPPPKVQKRITKQERRVRIVEYVDKFRSSNDGKFPSVTHVRQQVGGGHYSVRGILQELEYNHTKLPLGSAKAAPLQKTVEVAEHSGPKDDAMVAQLKGTPEFAEHSRPKDDSVKSPYNCDSLKSGKEIQDADDMLISQKDAATSTGIVDKTETWIAVGSSHQNVETEAAKHDNTSGTLKTADDPTLSDQTESESMKVVTNKSSVSLGVEAESDPGTWIAVGSSHHIVETEAAKHDNTSGTLKTADDPTLSDQTESESMKVVTNKSSVSLGVEAESDPGTWIAVGSSHHIVETEAAKHDNTSGTLKTADDLTLSDQTENESMKVITNKSSVSLGVEAELDPGNQQKEAEVSKIALENREKILNASESSLSDQSGSDKVIKANIHNRDHNPKHEPEESTSTGLFGSLKSLAYGLRNFWKNL